MLQEYGQKRDFTHTSEPPPHPERREGPLVFVVQKHAARRLHYDFRLELDGVLKSWSLPKGPSFDPAEKHLAVMVEDHPLDYRSFEGVIPKGEYGAGEVIVWDQGTYSPDENGELSFGDRPQAGKRLRDGLAEGKLSLFLRGQKLKGSWTLVKMQRNETDWLFIKHQDRYADAKHDVLKEERSALSGITIDELKSGQQPVRNPGVEASPADMPQAHPAPLPASLPPMLATPVKEPFDDTAWFFEPKLDGFRTIAFIQKGKVRLHSRGGIDVTAKYAPLVSELGQQPVAEAVLDGEIIALDEKGRLCFQCLQNYLESVTKSGTGSGGPPLPLIYYVFDMLHLDGYDLRRVPLQNRKSLLLAVLQTSPHVRLVDYFAGNGNALYRAAIDNGLEGVIAKERDSIYEPGQRSRNWLKVKVTLSDDFVIVGYTLGTGGRLSTFGSLLLGYYDDANRLIFAGHVGSGFDEPTLQELRRSFDTLKIADSPFAELPPANSPATWTRPELVAEVKYSQFTRDGYLRSPVFLRLRRDKPAAEVRQPGVVSSPVTFPAKDAPATVNELPESVLSQMKDAGENISLEIQGHHLSLSNLDKELWPATDSHRVVTKRDLIVYLARLSPYLLPHLRDRPLTFSRYPDGIQGEHFFQKHWSSPLPSFVETVILNSDSKKQRQEYLLCNNLATLLWLGQIANLEIHTWFSRVKAEPDMAGDRGVEYLVRFPDFIIFDIDPFIYSGNEARGAEPELNRAAFSKTSEVALWLREILEGLSLSSFVKTSGMTGIHVYVPVLRKLDYRATRSAAETIATFVQKKHPQDVTLDWAVEKRRGKIFIDYNQNVKGKTLASVYSPRPGPEATVSTPLRWDEVGRIYPTDFTIFTLAERLQQVGDLWHNIMDAKSDLQSVLKR